MKISTVIGAVSTALLMAVSASASHPEWSGKTGIVSISKGSTWTMDDEDVAYANANISRIDLSGTLILDNITTWPKGTGAYDCFFWQSAGTVIKRGSSSVTDSSYNYRLSGTLIIEEGEIVQNNYHFWGNRSTSSKVIIKDGATLRQDFASSTMGGARIIAEGTGVNGQGAVIVNKATSPDIPYLILSNDTYVVFNSSATILNSISDDYVVRNPALLEMNGYTLTIGGTAATVTMNNVNVTGGGTIKFASGTARSFNANGTTDLGTTKIETDADLTLTKGTWANGIALGSDATLTLAPGEDATILTVSGAITGEGNVSIGTAATAAKGHVVLSGDNAYTGTTDLYGADTFTLALASGTSIPDTEKFTQHGGTVGTMIGYKADGETPRWTADEVLSLAKAQQADPVKIGISDATDCDSLTIAGTLYSTYFPESGPTWSAFGTGDGGYTFEGPFTADKPLKLNIPTGTVRLTGDDTINLGSVTVTGTADNQGGTLLLEDAKDVVMSESYTNTVGNTSSSTPNTLPRMEIKDSSLSSGSLWIGRRSQGILKIEGDSAVSNKLFVGGSRFDTDDGSGVGAVYQRGSTVFATRGSVIAPCASHGYYELWDGSVTFASSAAELGRYGTCIFMQYGGSVTAKSSMSLATKDKCRSIYYLRNGTARMEGGTFSASYGRYASYAEVTVDGPDAEFDTSTNPFYCNNNSKSARTIVNLNNGGVLTTEFFSYSYASTATVQFPMIVNFNGGVLHLGYYYPNPLGNTAGAVSRVAVYEKGIGFDSYYSKSGKTYDTMSNARVPLVGATGNGIRAIKVSEPLTGYFAAPFVSIEGDGYGATAVAEIDSETATITNILVTSHGWGYTAENTTVKLLYNRTVKDTIKAENVEIAPNEVGGFTKLGAGTFSIYCTNSWAKWTQIDKGTLKVMTNGSIPPNTELILNGATKTDATLDLNGFDENADRPTTFSGVSGTGGTVKNGIVKIVGEWKVSAKKFVNRETTDVAGTVDLTDCTGIVITDAEALDESAKELRPLVLFKATTVIGLDGVAIKDVPNGWKVRKVANGFKMSADKGMLLLLR